MPRGYSLSQQLHCTCRDTGKMSHVVPIGPTCQVEQPYGTTCQLLTCRQVGQFGDPRVRFSTWHSCHIPCTRQQMSPGCQSLTCILMNPLTSPTCSNPDRIDSPKSRSVGVKGCEAQVCLTPQSCTYCTECPGVPAR
jgi:hypothetical protein